MSMPILELAEELTDGGKLLPPKRVWVTDAQVRNMLGKLMVENSQVDRTGTSSRVVSRMAWQVTVQTWWVELVEGRLAVVSLSVSNGDSPRFSNFRPSDPLKSEQLPWQVPAFYFVNADPKMTRNRRS